MKISSIFKRGMLCSIGLFLMIPGSALADSAGSESHKGLQLYHEACQKTSALSDLVVSVKLNLTFEEDISLLDVVSDIQIKYEDKGTEDMKYLMEMVTRYPKSNMNISKTTFFSDGFLYSNLLGIKFKAPVRVNELMAFIDGNPVTSPFDEKNLEEITVQAMEDSSRTVAFQVKTQEIQAEISSIYRMFGLHAAMGEVEFGDMTDQVVISAEGYCLSEKLNMPVNQVYQGQMRAASVMIEVSYENPGQQVLIDIPPVDGYALLQDMDGISRFLR